MLKRSHHALADVIASTAVRLPLLHRYASYKHPEFQPAGKLGPIASAALPGVLGSFAFLILGHLVSQLFSR